MRLRQLARATVPPVLAGALRRASGRATRFLPAKSWADALRGSPGYGDPAILARVVAATREVLAGRAAFERDGVLFEREEPPFVVLAPLLEAAVGTGALEVVDVGGSLGTLYRRCRPYLTALRHLRWTVVEQPAFVGAGAEFASEELRFLARLEDLAPAESPRVVLLSSALQYFERPHDLLAGVSRLAAAALVIDRTPLSEEPEDVLSVQQVPPHIYPASYPCWILSRRRLAATLAPTWETTAEFPCPEGEARGPRRLRFEFRGLWLRRRR